MRPDCKRHFTIRPLASLVAAALLGLSAPAAWAQSSPYYIGVAQTFTHESNLLRVRDGQVAPAGTSASDTISSTALVAGVDQSFGRQRLSGSAALRANRYADNTDFNSSGYSLNLGLDWQTIENLSGRVSVGADRTQRADLRDRLGQFIRQGNAEDVQRFSATARLGTAGPLSIEGGVNYYDLSYEAPAAAYAEYRQTGGSLGVRYRLGGATSVAVSLRTARIDYPNLLITLATRATSASATTSTSTSSGCLRAAAAWTSPSARAARATSSCRTATSTAPPGP
jgi:hypothetical protein